MGNVFLDAFLDSLKLFAVVLVFTYIIALIEPKVADRVRFKGNLAPLIGAGISLLPQCGFSVVATDLYQKRHITLGTLICVYIVTSDEALPVFLSFPNKALHILPLLACKLVCGILSAYLIDFIFKKNSADVKHHLSHCNDEYKIKLTDCKSAELVENGDVNNEECDCDICKDASCPHHQFEDNINSEHLEYGILKEFSDNLSKKQEKKAKINRFAIKPLLHSIEIFVYCLIVNVIFGIILYFVGEQRLVEFLTANKYLAPFLAVIVGAIPNCVSSIVISELYIFGGIGFGATLGGLIMNAGVAFIYLFKDARHIKRNLAVFALMFFISLFVGYITSLIFSFAPLDI